MDIESGADIEDALLAQPGAGLVRQQVAFLIPELPVEIACVSERMGGDIDRPVGVQGSRIVRIERMIDGKAIVELVEFAFDIPAQLAGELVGQLDILPGKGGGVEGHEAQRAGTRLARHPVPVVQASTKSETEIAALGLRNDGILVPHIVDKDLRLLTGTIPADSPCSRTAAVGECLIVDAHVQQDQVFFRELRVREESRAPDAQIKRAVLQIPVRIHGSGIVVRESCPGLSPGEKADVLLAFFVQNEGHSTAIIRAAAGRGISPLHLFTQFVQARKIQASRGFVQIHRRGFVQIMDGLLAVLAGRGRSFNRGQRAWP